MQRGMSKEQMVKVINFQKVLAASGAEGLPKLGKGYSRTPFTWQGMADLVDLLASRDEDRADLNAETALAWLRSADAMPLDKWDVKEAYAYEHKAGDGVGDDDAGDASMP